MQEAVQSHRPTPHPARYLPLLFMAAIGFLGASRSYVPPPVLTMPALLPLSKEVAKLPAHQANRVRRPQDAFVKVDWMPDGKRWVQLVTDQRAPGVVSSETGPAQEAQALKVASPQCASRGCKRMRTHLLGLTQTGHLLATPAFTNGCANFSPSRKIDFFEFTGNSAHPDVREYSIEIPRAEAGHENNVALASDEEVELAPQGNRIAWLLHRQIEFPAQGRFSRWIPWASQTSRLYTEIRITDLNGTCGRILGSIEFQKGPKSELGERPSRMHWLPDGRHISFVLNGSLWVVPTG